MPKAKTPSSSKPPKALVLAPPSVASAASTYAGLELKPPVYDPGAAKALLASYRPHLDAIPVAELSVPRLDVRAAALAALGAYAFVTQAKDVHARFAKLASVGEVDLAVLDHLKNAAFLVLYAHAQAEAAGALASDAKVPASLIQAGMEIEGRMQALCEYKFKNDPEIAPKLALLRPGSGHRDLAGDLFGYADIYAARAKEVASDSTNYRATDAADARKIAGSILAHLATAMSPKAREADELLRRAWTLLARVYFEVQQVGLSLLRYDEGREQRFPSLYAVGRAPRSRGKKAAAPAPASP
jgi:hypothetical protein